MIPLCWKCQSVILIDSDDFDGAKEMVGCKECPEVKEYADAKVLCPLLGDGTKSRGKHDIQV